MLKVASPQPLPGYGTKRKTGGEKAPRGSLGAAPGEVVPKDNGSLETSLGILRSGPRGERCQKGIKREGKPSQGQCPGGGKEEGSWECQEPRGNSWEYQELRGPESGTPGSSRSPSLGNSLLSGQQTKPGLGQLCNEASTPGGSAKESQRDVRPNFARQTSAAGPTTTSQRSS